MRERGVSIIELLVTIVILGILASTAVVNFSEIKQRAFDSVIETDVRNLKTAMLSEAGEEDRTAFHFEFKTTPGPFNSPYQAASLSRGSNLMVYRWVSNLGLFNLDLYYVYGWHDKGGYTYYWYDYRLGNQHYLYETRQPRN